MLDDDDIVYIQRQHTKRILPMSPSLGIRLPAHAVSMGRVLLAGLDDEALETYLQKAAFKQLTSATVVDPEILRQHIKKAREQGYAWIDRELDDSICGLAAPVRDRSGTTIAAINISLAAGEFDEASAVDNFLVDRRQTASQLRAVAG